MKRKEHKNLEARAKQAYVQVHILRIYNPRKSSRNQPEEGSEVRKQCQR